MSQSYYQSRINLVLDHIDNHLSESLSLDDLADIAAFSRFHFHRIFRAMVGESVSQYVNRIRLERSTRFLTYHSAKSITEIALEVGFSSSATFARAFKSMFGMTASEFRKLGEEARSKIRKTEGKDRQGDGKTREAYRVEMELFGINVQPTWKIMNNDQVMTTVTIQQFPETTLAYVRHIGPYAGNTELFGSLMQKIYGWAGPRGLIQFPNTQTLAVYHDDPHVTDEEKLRLIIGVTVPTDTEVDGEVGKMTLQGGDYAVGKFELNGDQYEEAWTSMYQSWLPQSGYQPSNAPAFESYLNDPRQHPEGKHIVEIWIPVEPAG